MQLNWQQIHYQCHKQKRFTSTYALLVNENIDNLLMYMYTKELKKYSCEESWNPIEQVSLQLVFTLI